MPTGIPQTPKHNSLMISKALTELNTLQNDVKGIKADISEILKYIKKQEDYEKKYVLVKSQKEELEEEKAQRWF
jgi:predicted patatin/cPLA2 family phospholipase